METFIKAAQLLTSLSLLIVLHEMGHFYTAKWFKTRVDKFYMFFDFLFPFPNVLNFSLFKWKNKGTEFGLGWFPLGGYVKIAGMADESMEELNDEVQPWEFRAKPAWQRLIILSGGVIVNFILGFLIYSMVLFVWGDKVTPMSSQTDGIWVADTLGTNMGFQTGDHIKSVNGTEIVYFEDFLPELLLESADAKVEIERDGQPMTIDIPKDLISQLLDRKRVGVIFSPRFPAAVAGFPEVQTLPFLKKQLADVTDAKGFYQTQAMLADLKKEDVIVAVNDVATPYYDQFKAELASHKREKVTVHFTRKGNQMSKDIYVTGNGTIGFKLAGLEDLHKLGVFDLEVRTYGFLEAFPAGAVRAWEKLVSYVRQIGLIFTPSTGAYKGVGGFGAIGNMFPAQWKWESFWNITAFLSIMLAFMNLLPIPALDGGHIVFVLYEMITRRKPNEKVMEYAQLVGFVLIIGLVLAANGNDIYRTFFK